MEKLIVLLVAIALIILGARGTYKALWNSFFPNEPIVTTPVSTVTPGIPGSNVPNGAAQQQNQSPSGYATNPNELGQQAAKATQQWWQNVTSGAATGATAHVVPSNTATGTVKTSSGKTIITGGSVSTPETVGRTRSTIISTGVPSWWPSWLPYPSWFPHPGEGQTGQDMPTPGAMGG